MNVKFTFNRNNISQSTQPGLKAHVQYVSKVVDSPAPSGIGAKSITANGTYYSASEGLEGYNVVDVNVSGGGGTLIEKSVSANGVYNASSDSADGYSKVTVNVPASAVDTGTKSITSNGTHDVTGYASASVSVPNSYAAADEGKVVSNGALVAQTSDTVMTNDTYDTTLINSLTVNVSGGGSITEGYVVKARDSSGYITDIDYYGPLYSYCLGCAQNNVAFPFARLENITFKSTITDVPANTFNYCGRSGNGIGPLVFPDVTSISGNNAFKNMNVQSLSFPALETFGTAQNVCNSVYLEEIYFPKLTTISQSNTSYGMMKDNTAMTYAEIGSVGYAAPGNIKNQFRGCSQSTLTICIYTTGDLVDAILTGLRSSTGAPNATVVFKASENTTYNSQSYSAGDTMLTSTPT